MIDHDDIRWEAGSCGHLHIWRKAADVCSERNPDRPPVVAVRLQSTPTRLDSVYLLLLAVVVIGFNVYVCAGW